MLLSLFLIGKGPIDHIFLSSLTDFIFNAFLLQRILIEIEQTEVLAELRSKRCSLFTAEARFALNKMLIEDFSRFFSVDELLRFEMPWCCFVDRFVFIF